MDLFCFPITIEKDYDYIPEFKKRAEEFFNYLENLKNYNHLKSYISVINQAISDAKKN